MRRLLASVVVCCVLASVAAGAGVHGTTIFGGVQTDSGDTVDGAVVLVQPANAGFLQNVTSGDEPVRAALVEVANNPPLGISRNRSDSSGNYTVHLSRRGTWDVVAVSESGVSRIYTVNIQFQSTTQDLTVDPGQIQAVEAGDGGVGQGGTATLPVRVENTDDEPIRNLTVHLGDLPAEWTLADVETDGAYRKRRGNVTWEHVGAGETALVNVTVSVPENASLRTYTVDVSATADEHFVEHVDDIRVRVTQPNETATPLPTATATESAGGIVAVPDATPAPVGGSGVPMVLVYANIVLLFGVAVFSYSLGKTGLPGR